jgi:hypothetical protein
MPDPHVEANIANLKRAWPILLNAVKRRRVSLHAVLSEGRPESLEGDRLLIRFPAGMDFAATQVMRPDNNEFLASSLTELTGRQLEVVAQVAGGPPEEPEGKDEGARILTHEELISLLQQEFDARPIDEGN